MKNYDVAVIGASFAGLACATACARAGLATVIVERKATISERPHTTGIVVKEAAPALDLPARAVREIRHVRLYAPSLKSVDLAAPDYFFLATDIEATMATLAERATAAGAELRLCAPFTGARGAERGVDNVTLDDHRIRCRILVGADGPRSQVARAFGLGRNRYFLRGVEAEFPAAPLPLESAFHCFLDHRIAPGYLAWVVPGVRTLQVGLAAAMPHRPSLDRLVARVGHLFGLERDAIVGHRGGLIPCGGPVAPLASGNVLLTGDAAGIVSPLTGGGIHTAHACGTSLGMVIVDYLGGNGPHPGEVIGRSYPKFRLKRAQRMLFERAGRNPLFNLAIGTPMARLLADHVFFRPKRLPA